MARTNTLEYIYIARDKMSGFYRGINKRQKKFTENIRKNSKAFALMQSTGSKAGRVLTSKLAGVSAAIGGGFGIAKMLKNGAKFEDAMLDMSAITGATGKDFEFLTNKTLKMAKASKTYQDEVATGMKLVASAKPELLSNLPALTKMTESMLLLKNAGGISLPEAVSVGAKSLNGFGKSAEFAGKFVDILAAGSKFGASEIKDTGEAVKITSSLAKEAGLNFLQLNALIQTAAKGSFFGTQAGTAINAIMTRMQTLGKLDFSKLGLVKPFALVKKYIDSITSKTEKAQFMKSFFGEEHGKVAAGILANIDSLRLLERQLATTGIAQEQAKLKLSSVSARYRGLGIAINEKVIFAFDQLKPRINDSIDSIKSWVNSIKPDDIDTFATSLQSLGEIAKITASGLQLAGQGITGIVSMSRGMKEIGTQYYEVGKSIVDPSIKERKKYDFDKVVRSFTTSNKLFGIFDLNLPKWVTDTNIGREAKFDSPKINERNSKTDINVNINAPSAIVNDIEVKAFGKNVNVGLNPS